MEICGLKLRNPVMPAAGPNVRDGDALVAAARGGAGGLVAKTVSLNPAEVPRPCIAKIKDSLINAETWSDLPLTQWLRVEYPKAKRTGLPLVASLGYTPEEVKQLAPRLAEAGVDALEISMHHVPDAPKVIVDCIKAAKGQVDIPVFAKLSPVVQEVGKLAQALQRAGADGLVAINTLGPCLAIDIETGKPWMGSAGGYGWLSGPAIKPLALRYVADIARAVDIPVIGVGGINDGKDAIEFIMAGASAVQVCTAALVKGPSIYGKIADEMTRFMRVKGWNSLEDFRGMALRKLLEHPTLTPKQPEYMASRCTQCGLCEKYCVYGAIKLVGKVIKIDPAKCYGCGLCVSVCPSRALLM